MTGSNLRMEKKKVRQLMVRRISLIASALVIMVLLIGYSLTIGSADISIGEAYLAVLARFGPGRIDITDRIYTIIWTLRMPRVIIAALVGATLGMAGCTTQAVMKNPLATPYTLGVSAGAGFGASIWFIFGIGLMSGTLAIIGNAFLFSLIPAIIILVISKRPGMTSETMILSGVAMSYIFSASNTILQFFAEDDAMRTSVFWLVGDLTRAAMWQVPYITATMAIFIVINMYLARDINIIKMGDEDAKGMGVNVEAVKRVTIISACFATATVISFTGAIGFVGMLAPHIFRRFIGGDERYLIPASGLMGACLMLMADIVARSLIDPVLLPVGAITALLGGPLLLYLLIMRGSRSTGI
jgi:iron complex transport system permease protein